MEIVGTLIGLVIGLAIGGVIGGLLIMLGSRLIMGSAATFPSAFLGALASGIVGAIIGFVIGFAIGTVAPEMANMAQWIAMAIGFLITPLIYSAIVKTSDGRSPSYVQGLLIYLIQLAILAALGFLLVSVFQVPIPMPGGL